jgi:hypothetical protein
MRLSPAFARREGWGMRRREPFAPFDGEGMGRGREGMGLDGRDEPREGWGTRLEEQGTKLEEQEGRLAAELSGSAGAVGFIDN